MSLDTKQKRGSAIHVSEPWRQWHNEPDGTIAATDRQAVVNFCSAVAFASPSTPTFDPKQSSYFLVMI